MPDQEAYDQLPVDITPMATIGLLLVIIFISTSQTWIKPLMDVDLPQAHTQESDSMQNITVSIGKNGELAIDDLNIKWSELFDGLLIALHDNVDKYIIIRADRMTHYGEIIKVMSVAKKAGAKHLTIATKQAGKTVKNENKDEK